MGIKNIIITNAAGVLNHDISVGTFVVIRDHIALPNMTETNPLLGPTFTQDHSRFLPVSDAYSPSLRRLAYLAAHKLSFSWAELAEGTYAWVSGPSFESPAEGRFLRAAGADVVGMSTVPEVLAAHEAGIGVLVLSLATNMVIIPEKNRSIKDEVEAEFLGKKLEIPVEDVITTGEVLMVGKQRSEAMRRLVEKIVDLISTPVYNVSSPQK